MYPGVADTVIGQDGRSYTSNHATIWRWREAFQNDLAARMDWSNAPAYEKANHPPEPRLQGASCRILESDTTTVLDAGGSQDPDGDGLRYRWLHYPEAGTGDAKVQIEDPNGSRTVVRVHPGEDGPWEAHVVLEVTDEGEPPLTRYQRVRLRSASASGD